MSTITWTAGASEIDGVAGKTFFGGIPGTINGVGVVKFGRPLVRGQRLALRVDTRPEVAALVADYHRTQAAEKAEREARWAREKDERAAADQPHIDKMLADEAALVDQIPAGAIRVEVVQNGSLDGDPILDYYVHGITIGWDDITMVGTAAAVRTGALGHFDCRRVAYITRENLDRIVAERQAKVEAEKEKKRAAAARREEIKRIAIETGKPQILRQWAEDREALEGGEWGDYVFSCTEYAMPDGTTKIKAVNQY